MPAGTTLVPQRPAPTPEEVGFAVSGGVASRLSSIEDSSAGAVLADGSAFSLPEEEGGGGGGGEYLLIEPNDGADSAPESTPNEGSPPIADSGQHTAASSNILPNNPVPAPAAAQKASAAGNARISEEAAASSSAALRKEGATTPTNPPAAAPAGQSSAATTAASEQGARTASPPAAAQPHHVRLAPVGGWLQKLGGRGMMAKWQYRWFELHPKGKHLFYYKAKPDRGASAAAPLGQIFIEHAAITLSKMDGQEPPGSSGHFTVR